jgi:site-specific DNA-cytosine methylase
VRQLTHGSLFDGFGGLRRGLEDAGFITRWAKDMIYGDDIERDDPAELERVDCISGGPPCVKGSHAAALHRSRTKQTLWPAMLRVVEVKRPDWVILENVPGFQREMVDWTAELHQLGYGCAGQLVDSRHWVPQQRTRCIVVGRLGAVGVELWNHLYADGFGVERGESTARAHAEGTGKELRGWSDQPRRPFNGSCADCVRDGIFARISARKPACMGAGNAVTQPLAEWIGRRIVDVAGSERALAPQKGQ